MSPTGLIARNIMFGMLSKQRRAPNMHISQSKNRNDVSAALKAIPQELGRVPPLFVVQSVALIAPYGLESTQQRNGGDDKGDHSRKAINKGGKCPL